MGRKTNVTSKEEQDVKLITYGNTVLEMAKKLTRDRRTINKEIGTLDKKEQDRSLAFKMS